MSDVVGSHSLNCWFYGYIWLYPLDFFDIIDSSRIPVARSHKNCIW